MVNPYNKPKNDYLGNIPSEVIFFETVESEGYILPYDIVINGDFDKILAESQIIDGNTIYERVTKKAASINLEFTLRARVEDKKTIATIGNVGIGLPKKKIWVFPSEAAAEFFQKVWLKDTVLNVKNSILNGFGIDKIIVESFSFGTVRGSTDMPVKLKCKENTYSIKGEDGKLIIA